MYRNALLSIVYLEQLFLHVFCCIKVWTNHLANLKHNSSPPLKNTRTYPKKRNGSADRHPPHFSALPWVSWPQSFPSNPRVFAYSAKKDHERTGFLKLKLYLPMKYLEPKNDLNFWRAFTPQKQGPFQFFNQNKGPHLGSRYIIPEGWPLARLWATAVATPATRWPPSATPRPPPFGGPGKSTKGKFPLTVFLSKFFGGFYMDMAWVKDIWHRCCFMYIYMYKYE